MQITRRLAATREGEYGTRSGGASCTPQNRRSNKAEIPPKWNVRKDIVFPHCPEQSHQSSPLAWQTRQEKSSRLTSGPHAFTTSKKTAVAAVADGF